jgi:ubiquinol-cytochrome c reductase cytochrome b subunit
MKGILAWLEERTGLPSLVRHLIDEDIPASSGWHQVFGSVALFLFLTQIVTGILLALNYAPTPGDAYTSLKFIMSELTGGRLIRGLHHWGASMMVVVVVMHMIQVFLWGAYKKPREGTWMVGVVLFLVTLAYALTGYLLPWDNKAYWGTVVTTQIASSAPLAGPYILRLMGAESGVGVLTFARFYSVHVLVLPPLTLLLIGLHLFLMLKHGAAPSPGDELRPKKKFYPEQAFKDTVAIFVAFLILFGLAVAARAPLGRLADPTDTTFIPRPEWYFLFLFQLLKYFEGPLEVVASVVLPGLAVLGLLLTPFIDRSAVMKVTRRTVAMGIVVFAALGWTTLTVAAVRSTPPSTEIAELEGPEGWQELTPEELAGVGFFRKENCSSCHNLGGGQGNKAGPDLASSPTKRDAAWLIAHFKQPSTIAPGSSMPPIQLSDRQLNALASFLLKINPKNAEKLQGAPAIAADGAVIYQQFNCGACHQVNGMGMKLGPPLNGLARRRSPDWVMGHFLDPKKFSPGSTMPPYKLAAKDNERLTTYLMALD